MASLAETHGFRDWRTIYDHPDNAGLRELRPDPNHLLPGDEVTIPDKEPKVESRMTGSAHRFVLKRPPTMLRLRLDDFDPERYRLTVGELVVEGSGPRIDQRIPSNAANARLEIWLNDEEAPTLVWQLALGHVDPHEEVTGVRTRLHNLGYRTQELGDAVRDFQADHGLSVTGEVNDDLVRALRDAHDLES